MSSLFSLSRTANVSIFVLLIVTVLVIGWAVAIAAETWNDDEDDEL